MLSRAAKRRAAYCRFFSSARDDIAPHPSEQSQFRRAINSKVLADFIGDKKHLVVITGAGVSTESNLPDYRSPNGSYSKGHKPVTFQDFMTKEATRKRYWARNMAAYSLFPKYAPNTAHKAIFELERRGHVKFLITQNVDGLHIKAGSHDVLELHGHLRDVKCMSCHDVIARKDWQDLLAGNNPKFQEKVLEKKWQNPESMARPDGDLDLGNVVYERFHVPSCSLCGGIMKPSVVFFGENVPISAVDRAIDAVSKSDGILVCGTSLQVYSAFRFIKLAQEKGVPYGIVNIGPTRGDDQAIFKIEDRVGSILPLALDRLSVVAHGTTINHSHNTTL